MVDIIGMTAGVAIVVAVVIIVDTSGCHSACRGRHYVGTWQTLGGKKKGIQDRQQHLSGAEDASPNISLYFGHFALVILFCVLH